MIPGSGRSPGIGNGTPLQYSGLENSMGPYSVSREVPRSVLKCETALAPLMRIVVSISAADRLKDELNDVFVPFVTNGGRRSVGRCEGLDQ